MSIHALWVLPLVFGALFYVLLPLFSATKPVGSVDQEIRGARRDQLAQEIADLELDNSVGRIDPVDYAREKQSKMQELGEILQRETGSGDRAA